MYIIKMIREDFSPYFDASCCRADIRWIRKTLLIMTAVVSLCGVGWSFIPASIGGFWSYLGTIGCVPIVVVIGAKALHMYLRIHEALRVGPGNKPAFLYDSFDLALDIFFGLLFFIISAIGPIIVYGGPFLLIWSFSEEYLPALYNWFITPVDSILKFRGFVVVGCLNVLFIYSYFMARYIRAKRHLPALEDLEQIEKEMEEYEYELKAAEQAEKQKIAQKKSWEKMKKQRREAEKRKAATTHDDEYSSEEI